MQTKREFKRKPWNKESDPSPLIVGVAADSGCGKSRFMSRIMAILGYRMPVNVHTPTNDLMTIICLDDYHVNDRSGRQISGRTALHPEE